MLPHPFAIWFHNLFSQRVPAPGASRRKTLGSQYGLLVLGCALWLINWLPIQTSGHVLSGTAVLSGQRWTALTGLCQSIHIDSDTIRWLDYRRTHSGTIGQHNVLTQIRLHVGLSRPTSVADIQRELDRLTRSTAPTSASHPVAKQVRAQQWQLEVTQHQMHRFKLDREREGVSLAAFERTSPFRQASYATVPDESRNTPTTLSESDLETWNRLVSAEASLHVALATLQRSLDEQRSHSDGHLAITGAPKHLAMAGRLSWSRVASVICLSMITGLVLLAMNQRLKAFRQIAPRAARAADEKPLDRRADQIRTTVKKLRQLQIPYWGEAVHQEPFMETVQEPSLTRDRTAAEELGGPQAPTVSPPTRPRPAFAAVLGDAMLFVWVTVFLVRFTSDSLWRDLVFRAPLAAFSSLFFGV